MFRMAAIALLFAPALALAQGGAGNGTINRPASNTAVQIGGQDPSFNLRALKVDADGALVTSASTGAANSGANAGQVQGNVASGALDSGNPVKIGGVYRSTSPNLTDGQRGDLQMAPSGSVYVSLGRDTAYMTQAADGSGTGSTGITAAAYNRVFNGISWDRQRGDTTGAYFVATPTANSTNAITPATGSLVNAVVGKASPGNLYGVEITTAASAGYLYVFNATAAPADGAVTAGRASGNYLHCQAVAATSTVPRSWEIPDRYSVGIVAVFSTTACGTLTKSATPVFLKVRAQ